MVRIMLKAIAAVALIAVGTGWNADARWSAAHAGQPYPFHLDLIMMHVAEADAADALVQRAPTEVSGVPDASAPAGRPQPADAPRAAGAHVITAGEIPSLAQSPPGSVIALPGGGFIATPGAAPVYVGPPGTQRTRILTP